MAKGQKRSSREIRKPKQEKTVSPATHSFGNKADIVANLGAKTMMAQPYKSGAIKTERP